MFLLPESPEPPSLGYSRSHHRNAKAPRADRLYQKLEGPRHTEEQGGKREPFFSVGVGRDTLRRGEHRERQEGVKEAKNRVSQYEWPPY